MARNDDKITCGILQEFGTANDETTEDENVDIREMLELQLAEVEMLNSMYPDENEFKLEEPIAVRNIQSFLNGKIKYEYLYSRIGFTVYLHPAPECNLEVVCHLPHEYPTVRPEIFIRSPNMPKENLKELKDATDDYMQTIEAGDICIGIILQWLEENASKYMGKVEEKPEITNDGKVDKLFVRLWIYSHHIFSKFKRRDLIDWGQELKLSGFSMPGKPGVICVEGHSSQVEEFWYRVRRLNWRKIAIKEKEEIDMGDADVEQFCKFCAFEEKVFDARAGKGREYHMDLGKFYEFLEKKDLGYIFSLYFGVEGKSTSAS
ncbi:RWD domain-containing protein 2B [Octopus bimaculoides]|uniref:RWD domain-containing protein n=1 Tax=Octopus bimaculoides TaxID=37653 RepID=A0A0L8FT12_OCTBM|nr:RWD domain-containing protein 2B [Octopus bimaculoides]|eukprot:XP_014787219.1 PREDICTED: RWD domain-containing protein 2B-like [Octopus bimaculoides]